MNKNPTSINPHASLKPNQSVYPNLGIKLNYLYELLGISQQFLADQLGISSGAISQWRYNGIPKIHLAKLCACLHINREDLEIVDIATFKSEIKIRFSQEVGAQWRFFYQQHSVSGLEIEIIKKQNTSISLKGLFPSPQNIAPLKHIPRIHIEDEIYFKLPVSMVALKHHSPVEALLLIVEHASGIQIIIPQENSPGSLIDHGYYYVPSKKSRPLFLGQPTGMQHASLVQLSKFPPPEVIANIQNQSGGFAADGLVKWLTKEEISYKINRIDFNVNN